ncbi:MAG: TIGR01244 family sulfur transferase [Parasphingopyxis sp.]|nr:TIGR01244 family phosphatase [Sphingomonadales bacterium]
MFRKLSDKVLAAPQIQPADIAEAKTEGVTLIINNRPDDEEDTQPSGDAIAKAASDAGIDYVAIPVTHAGFSLPQVEKMQAALEGADGKALAFCRTGARSTLLWALAETHGGADPDRIEEQAAAAGYDVSPIRQIMTAFAKQ